MAIKIKTILANPDGVGLPKQASVMHALKAHIKLVSLTVLGLLIFTSLAESPYLAILVLDLLFCGYLVSLFKNKNKYFFLLHPFVLLVSSQLFTGSFLSAGDGLDYSSVIVNNFNTQDLSFNDEGLMSSYTGVTLFKQLSLGVFPVFVVPEFFFVNPAEEVYYLWQGTFHVFLSLIVITLARLWRILEEKYLFAMALFVVLSPTCFELGTAPTRHYVTLFGIFLLLIAHLAIRQRVKLSSLAWYAIAVAVVVISKMQLLIPYLVFVIIDMFFINRLKLKLKYMVMILVGLVFILVSTIDYALESISSYEEVSKQGAASFGHFTEIPIIGWIVKYVFALLSPFPWSNSPRYIDSYAGNWFLFFMHTISALTGLYLFFVVIMKWRAIFAADNQLKQVVIFALIMSLSILKGGTGFHGYLSIYFVMLAPLLTIKQLQINPILPIAFVVSMEAFVVFGK